jgi:hypothetical protein
MPGGEYRQAETRTLAPPASGRRLAVFQPIEQLPEIVGHLGRYLERRHCMQEAGRSASTKLASYIRGEFFAL